MGIPLDQNATPYILLTALASAVFDSRNTTPWEPAQYRAGFLHLRVKTSLCLHSTELWNEEAQLVLAMSIVKVRPQLLQEYRFLAPFER